jgi:hypothetical protein
MHPTVVGLPCRLVLMVAHPGFPVDRPWDRQAPRAPLPHVGVTLMGKTSCAFSKGITLSSSLILAHAPSLHASSDFGFRPYTKGPCRLLPAPAASRLFPTLSLSYFPTCRDPYSSCSQGAVTRFFPLGHWPSPSEHGSALGIAPSQLLSDGERFWSCSHSFTFRPTGLFASQVAPTLTRICVWAAETFTAAHITVGYLPRAAAMLTIQTGQLMVRGLAPLRYDSLVGYSVHFRSSLGCTPAQVFLALFPQRSPPTAFDRSSLEWFKTCS